MNKKLLALAAIGSLFFASCDPSDVIPDPDPTPTPSNTTQTPIFSDGDGAIVAVMTRTTTSTPIGPMNVDMGTAVAVFGNLNTGSYVDAGTITLNGKQLQKQDNNSYVYIPGTTDPTGIDFSSSISWSVSNPSFTYNAAAPGRDMPEADGILGDFTTVDGDAAFTLQVNGSVSNADSVYFQINGPNASILRRMSGTTTSVTFTAAEMQSLGKSAGCSVTIAPWNYETKTFSGKTIHVVNELALNRVIEIN